MDDLISRQAAIDSLFELYDYQRDIDPTEAADLVRQGIYLAEKKIEHLPSAQPERKKGHWIREDIVLTSNPPQYQWHCSECGRLVHWFSAEILTDFCPNCGADMR